MPATYAPSIHAHPAVTPLRPSPHPHRTSLSPCSQLLPHASPPHHPSHRHPPTRSPTSQHHYASLARAGEPEAEPLEEDEGEGQDETDAAEPASPNRASRSATPRQSAPSTPLPHPAVPAAMAAAAGAAVAAPGGAGEAGAAVAGLDLDEQEAEGLGAFVETLARASQVCMGVCVCVCASWLVCCGHAVVSAAAPRPRSPYPKEPWAWLSYPRLTAALALFVRVQGHPGGAVGAAASVASSGGAGSDGGGEGEGLAAGGDGSFLRKVGGPRMLTDRVLDGWGHAD
jgi:hypothetical protein